MIDNMQLSKENSTIIVYDRFNSLVSIVSILFLCISYSFVSSVHIGLGLIFIYIIGILFLRLWTKSRFISNIFNLFFCIYGLYLLLTQIVFINGIQDGYFFHIDASKSFFYQTELYIDGASWSNLLQHCMLIYPDYPFAQVIFSVWWLIGEQIGVDLSQVRFFLRIQDLFFGPFILSIIALYLRENNFDKVQILRLCLLFGLFSYLLITSVIFSRDLHVAFFYTLLGYYSLSNEKHKFIYLKFFVLILLVAGFRIENGLFAICFPLYYYYRYRKFTQLTYLTIFLVAVVFILSGGLTLFLNMRDAFNEHTVSLGDGLYNKFNSLPFPLNMFFNSIYSYISPFPFIQYIADPNAGLFAITSIVSPFLRVVMLLTVAIFIKRNHTDFTTKLMFAIIIVYICSCSLIEPNLRRTFAIVPILFMVFCTKFYLLNRITRNNIIKIAVASLLLINLPATVFVLIK